MNTEQKYTLFIMSYKSVFKREPHPEFSTPEWRFVAKHGFSCSKSEIEDKEQYQHSNTAWLMFQFGFNAEQNLKSLEKTHATSYLP